MKKFDGAKNYRLLSKEELTDISSVAYTLEHEKTGAKVVLISNDDDNKAFVIGFRTPQDNSTGVPHILEHSVLGGSEKYPVKDAMSEVGKGSFNTYMNALTYPDRTLYPVASCNDKDFQNLMSVYLDAVFFPQVLKEKKIFMQEGWHYELSDIDDELKINGVVYNEMKGVYSSPDGALGSYTQMSLFPDTQYGVESGGDPDEIPSLNYEDFCNFYKKLYHPSNSRIFLYGDMDFEEKLAYIDEEYLSRFEKREIDSEIKIQKPFDAPIRVEKQYPIAETDDERDATYLTYNVVCCDNKDIKTNAIMSAINYALCSVPGAKLKERLIEAGIGKDVYSDMVTDVCQKVFSIIAENANPEDEERFVQIIEDTMREIIAEGFDKKAIEASIRGSEFSYREADFGYYPKGVFYGLSTFDEWLYSDENIFANFKNLEMYDELKKSLDTDIFEKTLERCVLNNNHKSIVVMKPVKGLTKKKDDELKARLAKYKDSLSREELERIVRETKELKEYQETPDSEEALATIPTLSKADIKKEIVECKYEETKVGNIKEIYTDVSTNGIAYYVLHFNAECIERRLLPALTVFKSLLSMVDTDKYSYSDVVNEIYLRSGGISFFCSVYKDNADTDKYKLGFEVRGKSLYDKLPDTFELVNDILFTSKLDDKKRVKEILEQNKSRIQSNMMMAGHITAMQRAAASGSDGSAVSDILAGRLNYEYLCKVLNNFDAEYEKLVKDMYEIKKTLLVKENLEISVGLEGKFKDEFDKEILKLINNIPDSSAALKVEHVTKIGGNEAFTSSSQVQFAGIFANYKKSLGLEYNGTMRVVKSILNTDYLWNQIRVLGGAYGCSFMPQQNGDLTMISYRDPKLKNTFEVFENTKKYLEEYSDTQEDVDRYIITTIGEMDTPLTASLKASRAYGFYKVGITNEQRQKERDEVLNTTVADVKNMARYFEVLKTDRFCSCVGNEDVLKNEGDMFDKLTPLM